MKILSSTIEFESAQATSLIKLECKQCQKEFFKRKNQIQAALKSLSRHTADFCSNRCARADRYPSVMVDCDQCGKNVRKSPRVLKKHKHHFCSQSCAATYSNHHKSTGYRRSKLEAWIESQLDAVFPNLEIKYNDKLAIQSELDIYIPSLKLAFELNGIFHYEPIYGVSKLSSIQRNDVCKFQNCISKNIELCIIDVSSLKNFKLDRAKKFLDIITSIISGRLT